MSEWEFNPYYNPAECGLEILAECAKEPNYDFAITVLFRDIATGDLYIAQDSGCSCPIPFEDFRSLADMMNPQTEDEVRKILKDFHRDYYDASPQSRGAFLRKWRDGRKH